MTIGVHSGTSFDRGFSATPNRSYVRLSCSHRSSLSLQEVLELGDGASTDSGWGESASSSSSSEEKRSRRERDGGDDDDERSTSSSGGGGSSSGRRRGASPVVSGPELAVFLFQGGVKGESDPALGAQDDSGDPSAAAAAQEARREGVQSSPSLLPSFEDDSFEYSGSCGEVSSGIPHGVPRTVEQGSSSTAVGKATPRDSDDRAALNGDDVARLGRLDSSERREAVVDRGNESSSLTGDLRGVGFVHVPVETSPKRSERAANEPTSCFF